MVIFVEISAAVKYTFFEIFCFPARNALYTLEEGEIMLWLSALIIYKPNVMNSLLAHFIYFDYYFSKNDYDVFAVFVNKSLTFECSIIDIGSTIFFYYATIPQYK